MQSAPLLRFTAKVAPHEVRVVVLAFLCNFVLHGSYYILRPLRDTMATVFGVGQLQDLFAGTFIITLVCAPIYAACASRVKLSRLLPGVFWLSFVNILIFYVLFQLAPHNRSVAAAYYWWFSVISLFLMSVFWTFMVDLFSAAQATRLFAFVAAGGSLGGTAGPVLTTLLVGLIGVGGLLLLAAMGFLIVILLVHLLMLEKEKLRVAIKDTQKTTLDHNLPGHPLHGFGLLLKSSYLMGQVAFILLMTWVATAVYILQADLVAKTFLGMESRTIAFASVDLVVNACSAVILIFGLGPVLQRFGVTAGLLLSPIIMVFACLGLAISPTLIMVQAARVIQRVCQYAVAKPAREVLFTVVDQQSKYKAKNVIDTVAYRFGDVTAAWMQAGLRAAGFGVLAAVTLGIVVSAIWGGVAIALGRQYEAIRRKTACSA